MPTAAFVDAERRGRTAETLCALYLTLTGWRVLSRRLKARAGTGLGEVDIVARRGGTLAFIEVKLRPTLEAALEAVTPVQRGRIARAADFYVQRRPELARCSVRFDVMVLQKGLIPRRFADAWRP